MKILIKVFLAVVLFVVAFFSFAPEDRVYSAKLWWGSLTGDPIAKCIRFHQNAFLSPESVRFVDFYPGESVDDYEFAIKVSARTQGGGRGHQYIDCAGKGKDYKNFEPSPLRQITRELKERNRELEKKIERQKRQF